MGLINAEKARIKAKEIKRQKEDKQLEDIIRLIDKNIANYQIEYIGKLMPDVEKKLIENGYKITQSQTPDFFGPIDTTIISWFDS